ncbi:MAG: Holliday junction branch migration protein RuvA [Bacteroidetes bacterium]|nr:MAG: Holliday junction branch migration protein RuvA [Bacteroidota bacterium]
MYAYLKGEITYRTAAFVTLEVHGVGYHLNIPLSTYTALEGQERTTLYTHFHITDDAHTLYGFATQTERNLFLQLISVTGVGPTSALLLLSAMSVDEIRSAIISEQAHVLQRAKGIGPKASKQIILDLKDKIAKEAPDSPVLLPMADNAVRDEALSALMSLGINRIAGQKALNQVLKERSDITRVEDLIKAALQLLH